MTQGRPGKTTAELEPMLARGPLPPFQVVPEFLPSAKAAALLDWATRNEARFRPTTVRHRSGQRTDSGQRVSVAIGKFDPMKNEIRQLFLETAPRLISDLRINPMPVADTELELVAHNDGAFYSRHIDLATGAHAHGELIRFLSAVYYVHRQPKAFSGGALRFHRFGAQSADDFVDVAPDHNTLVAFPSWAVHEVMPVNCPTRTFSDSRFAVNIWLMAPRALAEAPY
jgi:Rps23 Pro-64 3,4-dihydroxylase Tpa1-like proline 4-hydroxylase